MRKTRERTYAQAEASKAKAERFVRDVLQDEERADEIASESVESYAERRRFQIQNPGGVRRAIRRPAAPSDAGRVAGDGGAKDMGRPTLREKVNDLEVENGSLKEENEELLARLDRIMGVAAGDDEDEDYEDDEAEGDEAEDDDEDDDPGALKAENEELRAKLARIVAEADDQ